MKSVYVKSRLEPKLKKDAEEIIKKMGLSPSLVIQLLYRQIQETKKIPLGVFYSPKTLESIKELRTSKDLRSYADMEELMKDLSS